MTVYLSGYWSIQPYHSFRNAIKNRGRHGIFKTVYAYLAWRVKYWLWLSDVRGSIGFTVSKTIGPPPGRMVFKRSNMRVWCQLSKKPWC